MYQPPKREATPRLPAAGEGMTAPRLEPSTTGMLDVYSHFTPRAILEHFREASPTLPALAAFEGLPELWDIDRRLASLDPFDGLQQVLNLGNPPLEALAGPALAADIARRANEAFADLCARRAERFPAFTASLPMNDVDAALREIEHAVVGLGARGVQVYSNVNGVPLSDPSFRPIFQRMAELDLPILIHPYRGPQMADYATESMSRDEIWFTFGWPYETTACAARLVYSGLFDELPTIKIVLHHMGGMVPFFAGRVALGFEQIFEGPGGANPAARRAGLLQSDVPEYFRHFYADTAVNGVGEAVRCGHAFFGTEHSLFGTDAPFCPDGGPSFVEGALHAVDSLHLSESEQDRILTGNARSLFRLPS
jgi:predicted TIM-barrel fold metal-dependent hydrolase